MNIAKFSRTRSLSNISEWLLLNSKQVGWSAHIEELTKSLHKHIKMTEKPVRNVPENTLFLTYQRAKNNFSKVIMKILINTRIQMGYLVETDIYKPLYLHLLYCLQFELSLFLSWTFQTYESLQTIALVLGNKVSKTNNLKKVCTWKINTCCVKQHKNDVFSFHYFPTDGQKLEIDRAEVFCKACNFILKRDTTKGVSLWIFKKL